MSELEAAGPEVLFGAVFLAVALEGAMAVLAVVADFAGAAADGGGLAGEALGVEDAAGAIALSLAADFLLLLFLLLVALAGALVAAGALEEPVLAGVEDSAAVDFLLFFLLVPAEAGDVASEADGEALLLADFLLFFDFVVVLLLADAADWSLAEASATVFFVLFFFLLLFVVADVLEEDWSPPELLCAGTSVTMPKNTNNAPAMRNTLVCERFISCSP